MRELTLLLVLANLGFLAWGLWLAPEESPPAVAMPAPESKVPRIVLLSELAAAPDANDVPGDASPAGTGAAPGSDADAAPGASEERASAATPGAAGEPGAAVVSEGIVVDVVDAGAQGPDAGIEAQAPLAATDFARIAGPAPTRCTSLGPFLDLAETAEAAARLRERGYTPSQRVADSPVWVGNWVYLGPFATRAAANAAAESLRAQGVTDLYVEPAGEQQNTVSLGLFSDRDGAEKLASAVRKLGVTPQVGDRFRMASVYWVDVVVPADTTIRGADYQTRPGRVVRVEACAADAPAPGSEAPGG
jgi:hypothetical protein